MQAGRLRVVSFAALLLVGVAMGATLARGSQGAGRPGQATSTVTKPPVGKDGVVELRGVPEGYYLVLTADSAKTGKYPIQLVKVTSVLGCDPKQQPMCEDCFPGGKGRIAACINPQPPPPFCPPNCLKYSSKLPAVEVLGFVRVP